MHNLTQQWPLSSCTVFNTVLPGWYVPLWLAPLIMSVNLERTKRRITLRENGPAHRVGTIDCAGFRKLGIGAPL